MTRVSVPVSDDLRSEVNDRPDELELDPALSEGQRFAELIREGLRARRAVVRHKRRAVAYAEHATDPDYLSARDTAHEAAFEEGGF
jgi:hypothetical protein